MPLKISVSIVTYNNEKEIQLCLDSILSNSKNSEIILFDNDSKDKTAQIIKSYGPKIKIIESHANLGFGKAHNLIAKKANGNYLIILNPDTKIVSKNSLEELVKELEENPQYGIIAPKLILPNGNVQKSVRNLPTIWGAVEEYIFGIKGAYDFYLPDGNALIEVESVVGACFVIRKDLFESIGGFDEKYFMYFEDLDLCRKLIRRRLKIGYYPKVAIEHVIGASGEGYQTNSKLYESFKLYHSRVNVLFLNCIFLILRIKNKCKSLINA